jgi:hypothetical protein
MCRPGSTRSRMRFTLASNVALALGLAAHTGCDPKRASPTPGIADSQPRSRLTLPEAMKLESRTASNARPLIFVGQIRGRPEAVLADQGREYLN